MTRVAGLFPGQGSQSVSMGSEFFETSDIARALFETADRALGFKLSELCAQGPLERLTLTKNAQPAILVVSYICFKASGIELACAAGHSLGEYTALVAAGCLDFSDAVALVHKRGRYMQEAVPQGQGKMVAVMGPGEQEIRTVIDVMESGVVEIANLNCPGQTVVAGEAKAIDIFAGKMSAAGGKIIPLNVSAPFHCSLMKPAADKLAKDLDTITFSPPKFSVYSNVSATAIASAEQACAGLKKQVCASVRWTQSMLNMTAQEQITHTVEFGAGGVLTKLMKRINSGVVRLEVSNPASLAKAKEALGQQGRQ
jgi:[acyl-carrier-protein] S-malonyltransferase